MRFAICNEIYQGWKLEDALVHAARLGYTGMEIAPFTLANSVTEISYTERQRTHELALRKNIPIRGLHWLLVKPEGLSLNHTDARIRARTAKYFVELVDCCADLGGTIMVVGSPKQRQVLEGVSRQQAWDWTAATLQDAVKRAEDRGVTICFEPLSPVETNFINTAAEAIEFVKPFNSSAFKIILDVKAMSSETKPIPQIIGQPAALRAFSRQRQKSQRTGIRHGEFQTDCDGAAHGGLSGLRVRGGVQIRGRAGVDCRPE